MMRYEIHRTLCDEVKKVIEKLKTTADNTVFEYSDLFNLYKSRTRVPVEYDNQLGHVVTVWHSSRTKSEYRYEYREGYRYRIIITEKNGVYVQLWYNNVANIKYEHGQLYVYIRDGGYPSFTTMLTIEDVLEAVGIQKHMHYYPSKDTVYLFDEPLTSTWKCVIGA